MSNDVQMRPCSCCKDVLTLAGRHCPKCKNIYMRFYSLNKLTDEERTSRYNKLSNKLLIHKLLKAGYNRPEKDLVELLHQDIEVTFKLIDVNGVICKVFGEPQDFEDQNNVDMTFFIIEQSGKSIKQFPTISRDCFRGKVR